MPAMNATSPTRSLRSPPSPRGEGWHCPSGVHYRFTFQTARRASVSAPGNCSAPGRRPSCPPRKQSRRVKRRKALVRNAAPVAALRWGLSLQRKGLPASYVGRRALRRFTAVISVRPSPTRSGHACPSGSIPSTGGPAGSLLTGRIARKVESRAPRGVRLIRPDPQAPLPAPPTESPR